MEFGSAAEFEQTCKLFESAWERISTNNGSGLISLYYHPQEFIYRGFSDEVNFGGGSAPSSCTWQTFEQRTSSEVSSAYQYYDRLLTKLNEQESSIERLQKERDAFASQRDAARRQLDDYLRDLVLE
jgi:hypothetical protein